MELEGVEPEKVWNYDETNLSDDPGRKKVVMRRGMKYSESVCNSSKTAYSVMFCGNAVGETLPPYTVFKSAHLYDSWIRGGPKGARYNRTKSGWFDETTFTDCFFSMVLPRLKKQSGQKILIGDNLSSHLSETVVEACNDNNIRFIALTPNATHLLQPLDVAYFRSLKEIWRSVLREWKKSPEGRSYGTLPKNAFSVLLKQLVGRLHEGNGKQNLINGFRKCGLVPFNPEEVYSRLPPEVDMNNNSATLDSSLIDILKEMRGDNSGEKSAKKKRLDVEPGKSVVVPGSDNDESDQDDLHVMETEEGLEQLVDSLLDENGEKCS
jgi:hypothetical protein